MVDSAFRSNSARRCCNRSAKLQYQVRMNLRRCSIGQLVTETAFSQIVPVRPNVPLTLCVTGSGTKNGGK